MVNILLLMLLACSMTGSYKIVKITQYYDDYGPAPPQDEDVDLEMISNISKRNIGSIPKYWRRKGFQLQQPFRSLRSSSSSGDRPQNDLGDNIFVRTYRDDQDSNVYVDLRTEALMRGLG